LASVPVFFKGRAAITTTSGLASGPVGRALDLGASSSGRSCSSVIALSSSEVAPRAADERVVRIARGHERGLEALGQGQHGHEHAHRSRDAQDGHDGRAPAGAHALQVVHEGQRHQSLRRACTTCRRMAVVAGMRPARQADEDGEARARGHGPGRQVEGREHPVGGIAAQGEELGQPDAERAADDRDERTSTSTSTRTARSVKPHRLHTASSPVRSRTDMAMVLPATSSRVKKTTLPITVMRNPMLPICSTKEP
jgi:hypothetical protein